MYVVLFQRKHCFLHIMSGPQWMSLARHVPLSHKLAGTASHCFIQFQAVLGLGPIFDA